VSEGGVNDVGAVSVSLIKNLQQRASSSNASHTTADDSPGPLRG